MELIGNPIRKTRRKLECLMTAAEAAKYLRFSPKVLRRHCRAKRVPHLRVFNRLRFRRAELDAWIDECAARALDSD